MRLLHPGFCAHGASAAEGTSQPERRRYRSLSLGQSLPLRRLSGNHRSGESRGAAVTPNSVRVALLYPEDIHIAESDRVRSLERVPPGEIAQGAGLRKLLLKLPQHGLRQLVEAQERQVMFVEKRLDLRNRELVLHDVEQKIAAAAGAGKVAKRWHAGALDQLLPASADVVGRGAIAALSDESA